MITEVKKDFSRTRAIRPEATRKQSREIYILGTNLRCLQKDTTDRGSEAESKPTCN